MTDSATVRSTVAASLAGVTPALVGTTLNNNNNLPFETGDYLAPVFFALDKGLDQVGELGGQMMANATSFSRLASGKILSVGASGFAIALTLVQAAIELGLTINDFVEKEKLQAGYVTIVAEAAAPVSVKALLESGNDDDRRSLLLYWALATSPSSANAKLSEGKTSGGALCQVDEWSMLQCSEARSMVAAAAKAAGY